MKGYKIFKPDFTCNGMQYAENAEFVHEGAFKICNNGLHFCTSAQDCFRYYSFDPANIVCEVEARGEVQTHTDDSKCATNKLFVGRRLTWEEVLRIANTGMYNSGHSNSGNRNSGDSNSGNRNSGDSNSGDSNSGNRNSGNWNSGNRNSGYSNSGNWNSGNRNSGDSNSGYRNSGNRNSGNRNSGDSNSGNRNSGYSNSGDSNSGDRNSGDRNSGYRNSGNRNSGNWNSGNRNSGDSNSGYRNSGAFCVDKNPVLFLFDKKTSMTVKEWENHPAVNLMYSIEPTIWVPASIMTEAEKKAHPKWETTGGYLKKITMHEAWSNTWHNWDEDTRKVFTTLPNFDAAKFEEITGINVIKRHPEA